MDRSGLGAFEQEWPELARRLSCTLRRRNVPSHLVDDIVQETGLRLYRMWDEVDPSRSLWGLILTVSKNLLWDETHRRTARELLIDVPERANEQDVERAGIARLELWRVSRALDKLSPAHRSVLLAEVDGAARGSEVSKAATKMMRMRARRRLTALLENASASCLAIGVTARRWALNVQQFVRKNSSILDAPAPMAVAAVLGAVVVMAVPTTALPSPRSGGSLDGAKPEVVLSALRSDAHDGWETSLAADDETKTVASSPSRAKNARRAPQSYGVAIGDDSAGAEARVKVTPKERKLIRAPSCSPPDTASQRNTVIVRCRVDTRDETYDIEAKVRVPLP